MVPLVSLVLPVKNGLPHLRETVDSICRQTYSRYEIVVQDGGSTDGTLEYLASLRMPNLRVASAPDGGVGQAYNRGLQRASGDFICFTAADEQLEDDALERAVGWCARHPESVAVNGSVRLINRSDRVVETFRPPHFNLLGHLTCEVVLAFAGLLNRKRIGSDLYYDESLKTCPDYDFWIRLGSRFEPSAFVAVDEPFKIARADAASMSYRADAYEQFCKDKLLVLHRFLDAQPAGPLVTELRRVASAGIYAWAAESLFSLQGGSPSFIRWCREATRFDPWSPRLAGLAAASAGFTIDQESGELVEVVIPQADEPDCPTTESPHHLDLANLRALPVWTDKGASIERGVAPRVRTPDGPWEYAAEIPLSGRSLFDVHRLYWARIELQVFAGEVGISLLVDNDVFHEKVVRASQGRSTVFVKISRRNARGILIRNGGERPPSVVELLHASIESCPKPEAFSTPDGVPAYRQ